MIRIGSHFITDHGAAGGQLTAGLTALEYGPEELGIPFFLLIMFQPKTGGIFPRNDACAENHIPKKEHIPEISFVMSDAIVVAVGMMGMGGRGSRDQPFEH